MRIPWPKRRFQTVGFFGIIMIVTITAQYFYPLLPVVRISVNLSRKHMVNRNLLADLVAIIDRNRVPHQLAAL